MNAALFSTELLRHITQEASSVSYLWLSTVAEKVHENLEICCHKTSFKKSPRLKSEFFDLSD